MRVTAKLCRHIAFYDYDLSDMWGPLAIFQTLSVDDMEHIASCSDNIKISVAMAREAAHRRG